MGMARPGVVETSLPEQDMEYQGEEDEVLLGEFDDGAIEEELAIEAEARGQGWRPLAEYRGKPGGWKTARQFVEDGKNFLPFVQKERDGLKQTVSRMTDEMSGIRGELAKTQGQMQQLLEYSRRATKAGYDKAVAELKAEQRNAVADGDTAKFDAIETQLDQMEEAREESVINPSEAPKPVPAASIPSEVMNFITENEHWYNKDRTLNSAMIAEHNRIIEESPNMPLSEQLEAAKEVVMTRFPKKAAQYGEAVSPAPEPQQRRPASPMGPTSPQGPRNGPRGRNGIDAIADPRERSEAREGFARAQRNAPGVTEEEFLEIFNNPHADVLEVQRKHRKLAERK